MFESVFSVAREVFVPGLGAEDFPEGGLEE